MFSIGKLLALLVALWFLVQAFKSPALSGLVETVVRPAPAPAANPFY